LINPFGEVYTCWTIDKIIGNILDIEFQDEWHAALEENQAVLTGDHPACKGCGFSHSRMPDPNLSEMVAQANNIRLAAMQPALTAK
jgi:MoaA/NifB/PqqE/SkfB family radical SAM enzyme